MNNEKEPTVLEQFEKQGFRFKLLWKTGKLVFETNPIPTGTARAVMRAEKDSVLQELISRLPPNPYSETEPLISVDSYEHKGGTTEVVWQ